MPRCKKCGQKFDDDNGVASPAKTLGELFLEATEEDPRDLCPRCREELGIFNLLGFDE